MQLSWSLDAFLGSLDFVNRSKHFRQKVSPAVCALCKLLGGSPLTYGKTNDPLASIFPRTADYT